MGKHLHVMNEAGLVFRKVANTKGAFVVKGSFQDDDQLIPKVPVAR